MVKERSDEGREESYSKIEEKNEEGRNVDRKESRKEDMQENKWGKEKEGNK